MLLVELSHEVPSRRLRALDVADTTANEDHPPARAVPRAVGRPFGLPLRIWNRAR